MAQLGVKVGKMPGKINNIFVDQGSTVGTAVEKSGLDPRGYEVRVNGKKTDNMNTLLKDGDTILLVKQIKGNYRS